MTVSVMEVHDALSVIQVSPGKNAEAFFLKASAYFSKFFSACCSVLPCGHFPGDLRRLHTTTEIFLSKKIHWIAFIGKTT